MVSFVLALNKVSIVAVTTLLVLHVSNGQSEHVCLDIMFLAIRVSCSLAARAMRACAQGESGGPCRPGEGEGFGGAFAPPGKQGGLGGGTPPNVGSDNSNFFSPEPLLDLLVFVTVFN